MKQQQALSIMMAGHSVLLTGAAGTGKTHILKQFIRHSRQDGKNIAVTATTGLAATHLGGTTIHAWSGIGIKDQITKEHLIKMGEQRKKIINAADILIIDEISMLHDYRLDMIDEVCRHVRESNEHFGGLQVILCGDFYQLPPVNRADSKQGGFIVESKSWMDGNYTVCYLEEQFRQKEDQAYSDILNGIRSGILSKRQLHNLLSKQHSELNSDIAITRLLTTNIDTDTINTKHLKKLSAESVEYHMTMTGSTKYKEQLIKSCLAPEVLTLKVGAQVMCIKNSPEKRYVNGSLGVVVGFEQLTNYPKVKLNNGNTIVIKPDTWELVDGEKVRATATQIPLRLAWAITVHKSQGMTLDAAQIDLSKAFVEGMGYVALSRVKSIDTLSLDGINRMALLVSDVAKAIDVDLRTQSRQALTRHAKDIEKWQKILLSKPKKVVTKDKKDNNTWADRLAKMRKDYPNAYKSWTETDDKKLVEQFSKGKTIKQLSKALGRHEGSIKVRLQKHLGQDIFG